MSSDYVNPLPKKTFRAPATGAAAPTMGEKDILQKKLLVNPRYARVQPVVRTGTHAGNLKAKPDRTGEIFKRVSRRLLHNLIVAHEEFDESVYGLREGDDASSTLTVTTVNAYEGEIKAGTPDDPSYLLLDIRDPDQYDQCHIESAINFPSINIRRDKFSPDIYKFKNAKERVIIVYDVDDAAKVGSETVIAFIQKGFDNVVLLTGGLKHFAAKYPSRMIGEIPVEKGKTKGKGDLTSSIGGLSLTSRSAASIPTTPASPESVKSGISLRTNRGNDGRESPRENLRARQIAGSRATNQRQSN